MFYYLGKGTVFKKENCKEYKTIEGALKAAAKDEDSTVWDEMGVVVGSLTDNVPEGALSQNPDGSVNTYDADGIKTGTVDNETVAAITGSDPQDDGNTPQTAGEDAGQANPPTTEKGQNEANTVSNDEMIGEDVRQETPEIIVPHGAMKVTVICDGALNLRRSPEWGNENICGRAVRGQSYYVKAIHTVAGKKIVQTVDDVFLSGQSEHVQFEQL